MRMLRALVVAFPIASSIVHAQHTHGVATLDVAIDERVVNLRLVASADDVYGFERAPRTDAERAARSAALEALRASAATLFAFDPKVGCAIASAQVSDDPPSGGSSHREVVATYVVRCQRSPAKTALTLGVFARFPNITSVKATRLSTDETVVRTLKRGSTLDL